MNAIARAEKAPKELTIERASYMLTECRSVDEAKGFHDKAIALQVYQRKIKASESAHRSTAAIILHAKTRCGELLAKAPKARGTKGQLRGQRSGSTKVEPPEKTVPTLADQGIDRKDAAEWQKLAEFKAEDPKGYERKIEEVAETGARKVTPRAVLAGRTTMKPKPRQVGDSKPWTRRDEDAALASWTIMVDDFLRGWRGPSLQPVIDALQLTTKKVEAMRDAK